MKIRRLLPVAVLLLLVTSRADAEPINLLLTTDITPVTAGPPEVRFGFSFFQSPTYGWPSSSFVAGWPAPAPAGVTVLASGNTTLLPGVTQFNVSLNVDSLDDVYFIGSGWYFSEIPQLPISVMSLYVAEPPTGRADDQTAWIYGPPWISMADLGSGMSSYFSYINGYSRPGGLGTFQVTPLDPAPAPVPEPASLLLLGTGLAAVAGKKVPSQAIKRVSVDA